MTDHNHTYDFSEELRIIAADDKKLSRHDGDVLREAAEYMDYQDRLLRARHGQVTELSELLQAQADVLVGLRRDAERFRAARMNINPRYDPTYGYVEVNYAPPVGGVRV